MNYRYLKENLSHFMQTPVFKVLYIVSIVITLSIAYGTKSTNSNLTYIQLFLALMTNGAYVFYCLFFIPLITSISIYFRFEKNLFHILRLRTKKKYLSTLLKQVLIVNGFLFLVTVLTTLCILNLFGNDFTFSLYGDYNISNLLYLIYSLVRVHLISQMFVIISVCLFKIINPYIVLIANVITYIATLSFGMIVHIEDLIGPKSMSFWVGDYIIPLFFETFTQEISYTFAFLVLLSFLILIIFKITPRFIKQVGD